MVTLMKRHAFKFCGLALVSLVLAGCAGTKPSPDKVAIAVAQATDAGYFYCKQAKNATEIAGWLSVISVVSGIAKDPTMTVAQATDTVSKMRTDQDDQVRIIASAVIRFAALADVDTNPGALKDIVDGLNIGCQSGLSVKLAPAALVVPRAGMALVVGDWSME